MSLYLLVKSAHVIAVITWAGTMIIVPLLLRPASDISPALRLVRIGDARRIVRRVSTPAMLATWVFGTTLMVLGAWLPSIWLVAKLVFVVTLTGLHGVLSGRLRQLCEGETREPTQRLWRVSTVSFALITGIVPLVVFKPF